MSLASESALLLIDFINDLEFEEGEQLFPHALLAAQQTAALKARLSEVGTPAIYVNDHFGQWRSDFRQVVERCTRGPVRGKPIAELLRPNPNDYFVLKPRHSAFFCTPLELLLESLRTRSLILTGLTTDMCVLFTANDAYVRKFELFVPEDCTAAINQERKQRAMRYMEEVVKANVAPSTEIHSHLA